MIESDPMERNERQVMKQKRRREENLLSAVLSLRLCSILFFVMKLGANTADYIVSSTGRYLSMGLVERCFDLSKEFFSYRCKGWEFVPDQV